MSAISISSSSHLYSAAGTVFQVFAHSSRDFPRDQIEVVHCLLTDLFDSKLSVAAKEEKSPSLSLYEQIGKMVFVIYPAKDHMGYKVILQEVETEPAEAAASLHYLFVKRAQEIKESADRILRVAALKGKDNRITHPLMISYIHSSDHCEQRLCRMVRSYNAINGAYTQLVMEKFAEEGFNRRIEDLIGNEKHLHKEQIWDFCSEFLFLKTLKIFIEQMAEYRKFEKPTSGEFFELLTAKLYELKKRYDEKWPFSEKVWNVFFELSFISNISKYCALLNPLYDQMIACDDLAFEEQVSIVHKFNVNYSLRTMTRRYVYELLPGVLDEEVEEVPAFGKKYLLKSVERPKNIKIGDLLNQYLLSFPKHQIDFQCKKYHTAEERLNRFIPLSSYSVHLLDDPCYDPDTQVDEFCLEELEDYRFPDEEKYSSSRIDNPLITKKGPLHPFETGTWHSIGSGGRDSMQDEHIYDVFAIKDNLVHVFGIFDGHGRIGEEIAHYLKTHISKYLLITLKEALGENASFKEVDPYFLEQAMVLCCGITEASLVRTFREYIYTSGATACLCLEMGGDFLFVNVGDSRAIVVSEAGEVTQMTEDASPSAPSFMKSIIKRGGKVDIPEKGVLAVPRLHIDGCERGLALARTFGDENAPGCSFVPKVRLLPKEKASDVKIIILTCDGIYESLTSLQVGSLAYKLYKEGMEPQQIAKTIAKLSLFNKSMDNISITVVIL